MIWVTDLLAFLAIAGTGDISLQVFLGVALFGALSQIFRLRLSEKPLFFLLLTMIVAGVLFAMIRKVHPILIAGHLAPLLHSALWFSQGIPTIRKWRLAIGFIEVAAASALSPEFYLAGVIVLFSVFGLQALSQELVLDSGSTRPPKGFRAMNLRLALGVLMVGLVLFPFLPRTQTGLQMAWEKIAIGYTDSVDLSRVSRIEAGDSKTALRVFLPREGYEIPGGLIRTRSLDVFDGGSWFPGKRPAEVKDPQWQEGSVNEKLELIREPLQSPALPVFYGTQSLRVLSAYRVGILKQTEKQEWILSHSEGKRVQYEIALGRGSPDDEPTPSTLKIPQSLSKSRLPRLAQQVLAAPAPSAAQVRDAIRTFYSREGFQVTTDLWEGRGGKEILETFLFDQKKGHCELFASSAAILFRLKGIPSRLVSGFRVSRPPVGNFLHILESDAHAWVEYWNESQKLWETFDPTPVLLLELSWKDVLTDQFERVKSYWYRYIVTYDPTSLTPRAVGSMVFGRRESQSDVFKRSGWMDRISEGAGQVVWISLGLGGGVGILIWVFVRANRKKRSVRRLNRSRELDRVLSAYDQLTKQQKIDPDSELVKSWFRNYERVRFHRNEPTAQECSELLHELDRIKKGLT